MVRPTCVVSDAGQAFESVETQAIVDAIDRICECALAQNCHVMTVRDLKVSCALYSHLQPFMHDRGVHKLETLYHTMRNLLCML